MKAKKPLLVTATFFLAVYMVFVLASYFYLPGKLKTIVQNDVAAMIGRDISVEAFQFNPFQLQLTCHQLAVSDTPNTPILEFQSLSVDLGFWQSLFKFYPVIESIDWVAPEVQVHKLAHGFNFDSIVENLSAAQPEHEGKTSGQADSAPLRLLIESINIQAGEASYFDSSKSIAADAHLENINVSFENLYIATGADNNNPYSIVTKLSNGGTVTLKGEYRLEPLYLDSQITLSDLALAEVSDFLRNIVNADLSGHLNGNGHLTVQQIDDKPLAFNLTDTDLVITALALDDLEQGPKVVEIDTLKASGIAFDLNRQSLTINQLIYDGLTLNQWRNNNGEFRYQSLMVRTAQPEDTPATAQAPTTSPHAQSPKELPWQVDINTFSIQSSQVLFSDRTLEPAAQWNIDDISLLIEPLHLTSDQPSPLQISATLNEKTSLHLQGEFTAIPFSISSQYAVDDFLLESLNPYLASISHAIMRQGTLSTSGNVQVQTLPELSVSVSNNLAITNFELENLETHSDVLSFSDLNIEDTNITLPATSVSIANIELANPTITLEQAQRPNWELMKADGQKGLTEEVTPPNTDDKNEKPNIEFALHNLSLTNGNVNFEDASLSPTLRSSLNNIDMKVTNFSTLATEPAQAELSANVNHQAPFELKSNFNLNETKASIEGSLAALDLRHFSPYTAAFMGFATERGNLNYDFGYTLEGTKVDGSNRIKADDFYLGERVPSEKAINAPVKLGMSLLRDFEGGISLDLDINGDRSDPSFSVGGLLAKALTNILVKVAASPFTMLGSLLSSDQDLSSVTFTAASAELDEQSQTTLKALASALKSKPELVLDIRGNATPGKDAVAIARQQVVNRITPNQKVDSSALANWRQQNTAAIVREFNKRGAGKYQELRESYRSQEEDKNAADTKALSRAFDLLVQDVTVDTASLLALADARSEKIQTFLLTQQLEANQVAVRPAQGDSLNGTTIKFELETQ
ncbi:DUF748 domain-containing protein [Gilvimarinus sp. SDUM040013]|uniref:DUF748 domain-containing protein n=1 Tax=Gilvimarinus gilvus TaxID=3058038 RepID=A0ABU4S5S5_9GAMM|nr:DUF748 domain-containing protein [Gilvimarinus sp. SDUM040013]MDO3384951.1 DUF748 domain-containing protein [Gilvimarinus sp. SDUM040013]MDX6851253.1 DUF748 domain-containing protein [Gilvimarinus sp. SDUM040013]